MGSKFIRLLMVWFGAIVVLSGAVNLVSAIMLLEPSDEDSLGINRTTINVLCGLAIVAGGALVYLGLKKKK